MITTFYPPYNFGGDGIFLHRLSNELARRGHQVDVIHCIDAYRLLAHQEPKGTYDNHSNVTVHSLKSRFGFLSPLATQQTGFPFFKSVRIRKILKKGFDVIHYHNISLVGGPGILKYGEGIKLYTMHEYWLVCPIHVLFRFNQKPCTHPHCFLCTSIYKRPPQWWRYLKLLKTKVKHVNAFIAPSLSCRDIHQKMGLNVPIVHLPNFIPSIKAVSSKFEDAFDEAPEGPYFLLVGRLEKLKGLQTIIPIFHRYKKAQLLISGEGSNYETKLRQLAKGSVNIRFLGYLSDRQLQSLYRHAVAVIVPSICYEVFPLVIIEAFRQQTPAIVRNLGGMPEIIKDSNGGFIYNTEGELLEAMDRMLADPSYRRDLGMRGHQAYLQKWTTETHLQSYFALIHKLGANKANSLARLRQTDERTISRQDVSAIGGE
jgi:glycosyltransferase involved in cell wall biosynthesis